VESGVLVVIASGNNGSTQLGYPANQPGVISVGAADAAGQSMPSSNVGYPTFTAPGYGIPAAYAGMEDGMSYSTGTSPAAAVISGMLAAELSRNPSASPEQLVTILQDHSNDLGQPGNDAEFGFGMPDAGRLTQRDRQVLDVAASSAYLGELTEDGVTVFVTAQNRGTVPLVQGQFFIEAGGMKLQPSLSGMEPNETRAFPVVIPWNRIDPEAGISISATTGSGFATDVRPENNTMGQILRVTTPE
jgi:hypothetical protein